MAASVSCMDSENDSNCSCAICADNYGAEETKSVLDCCSHVYHEGCIMHWVASKNTCPQCRRTVHTITTGLHEVFPPFV
jgi:hypothetical protein